MGHGDAGAGGDWAAGRGPDCGGHPIGEGYLQNLAYTASAKATLEEEAAELLEAVRPAAALHIWEFNPQNLANTARALAKLVVEDSELLEAMQPAAVAQPWECKPQELANTA